MPIVIEICAYVISTEVPVLAFARKHWGVVEKSIQIDFSTRPSTTLRAGSYGSLEMTRISTYTFYDWYEYKFSLILLD